MTDPNNPYLMDPAKQQRQQARTDLQNQRTATRQMGQQVQTAMGQLPAQPVPQVASDAMQGYEQLNQAGSAMQGYENMNQQANLMQTHFPGGPPQQEAKPLPQQQQGDPYMTAQLNDPAAVAQQALVQAQKPQGAQLAAIQSSMGPLRDNKYRPQQPGGFQPKQMLGQVQGMQRAKQMESMARPSAVRSAFKQAQTTGAVPGVKPPKPPQY